MVRREVPLREYRTGGIPQRSDPAGPCRGSLVPGGRGLMPWCAGRILKGKQFGGSHGIGSDEAFLSVQLNLRADPTMVHGVDTTARPELG